MNGVSRPISLHSLRRKLVSMFHARGRDDLARDALDRVAYTDDGATLYVHILPKASWPHRQQGQAYVLAFEDKQYLTSLARHRELLRDAALLLDDEIEDIIRWFDGR